MVCLTRLVIFSGDIQRKVADLPTRAEFDELKQDVRVIRAAVTDLSRQVNKQSTVSVT